METTANLPAQIPVADVWKMAQSVASSGLFEMKEPNQAMSLMLIAQAEGMHPALAARDYHIIQGRPALKADAMLARFQQAGGTVKWTVMSDEKVAAKFSHPKGGSVEIDWDMERAKSAELTGKKGGMWSKYPRQMLRARVISEGIRTVYPGVVIGVYTPEEVRDFDDAPESNGNGNGNGKASVRDMGPANIVDEPKKAAPQTQAETPEIEHAKKLAEEIKAAINGADDLDALNKVWADYQDGLDEVGGVSESAREHLEAQFRKRLVFLSQKPADEQAEVQEAAE